MFFSSDNSEFAHFYDNLWGYFRPPEKLARIVDTYEMQRLAKIKQLSTLSLVFRTAAHTRLAHSLGVAHLVSRAIEHLKPQIKKEFRSEREISNLKNFAITCAMIHDVGHGPFSHFVEPLLEWLKVEPPKHEFISRDVIRGKFWEIDKPFAGAQKPLFEVLQDLGREPDFSLDEFAKYATELESPTFYNPKEFVHQLISSPIDMDRLDYLSRDLLEVGVKRGGIDVDSIIKNLTLVKTDKACELAIIERGLTAFETLLVTRDLMYADVYHHPINRWALAMLLRATYRLITKHQKGEWQKIIRLTDENLLQTLWSVGEKNDDEYLKDASLRISLRQPYFRVKEVEYRPRDFKRAKDPSIPKEQIESMLHNPERVRTLEMELKNNLAKKFKQTIDIIVDVPSIPVFRERDALVKLDGEREPRRITEVSLWACFLVDKVYERRWILRVFTNVSKHSKAYNKIVKSIRDYLGLRNVKPSLLL